MTIKALDWQTVKLLTTTQVITSISSAAKELIENALDANAKNIEINLTDNGCTLIEVKDDGCGISKHDAPYMALASYTSKILNFSDLESLETYGFRGQALHALSALSDLIVTSKTEQDETAVRYTIDHSGQVINTEPCHRATGTTIHVKELFKRIPVRRQVFTNQRKAVQDIKTLESLIKSYAICKFSTRLSYRVDSNIIFAKPSTASLEEAVSYIIGKRVTNNMNWLDIADAKAKIKIMVPSQKAQNISEVFQPGAQYIFINDRPVKHKQLEKTLTTIILEALGQESLSRKKPIFVLYITTNPSNIDVNLEPNKTSILFKEQNVVVHTIEKYLESFYGICREEVQQEVSHDCSSSDYQDYSQQNIGTVETELPACKRRKCQAEENVVKVSDTNASANDYEECPKESEMKSGELNIKVPPLDLSETDSNDSQKFIPIHDDKMASHSSVKEAIADNAEDSPPFELSQPDLTLSQLPFVDLGDDLPWNNCSSIKTNEKENVWQSVCTENAKSESNSIIKKPISLEEWSKGHVSGLKGCTDVRAYNYAAPKDLSNDDAHGRVCKGFLKFSRQIRSQVMEKNPGMTAPQVAHVITNLWKKLSPEERGYYRDIARDEISMSHNVTKRDAKQISQEVREKNKNRLLRALEKMKTLNVANKENLVMRTVVPFDVNLKKVTDCFLNNRSCENTNSVVGHLCSDLWIVHKSAHIWVVDERNLQRKLHKPDVHTNKSSAEDIELLLQQWFSKNSDLSLLHPIHSLTVNRNNL